MRCARACVCACDGVKYNIQRGQIRDYPSAKRQAGFGFGDLQMESWEIFFLSFCHGLQPARAGAGSVPSAEK